MTWLEIDPHCLDVKPAPVAPPSQGAEEAWRAFRAKWEDREIHYDSGDKQLFDAGYAAAKAEQAAGGVSSLHVPPGVPAVNLAASEPLRPTTEELIGTVREHINTMRILIENQSGFVGLAPDPEEAVADAALAELARRCAK